MKFLSVIFIVFFTSCLFAETMNVSFSSIEKKELTLIKTIYYGEDSEQVGISIPEKGVEELPFGPNTFTLHENKLFISDNVNRRIISFNIKNQEIAEEFLLPDTTFRKLFFKDDKIMLLNGNNNRFYERKISESLSSEKVCTSKSLKPVLSLSAYKPKDKKEATYPDTMFLGQNRIRLTLSKDKFIDLNFTDINVSSFSFKKKDEENNFHFKLEIENGKIERYHVIFNPEKGFITKIKIPSVVIFTPEDDLFVADNGSIMLMFPDKNGLKLFKGGIK